MSLRRNAFTKKIEKFNNDNTFEDGNVHELIEYLMELLDNIENVYEVGDCIGDGAAGARVERTIAKEIKGLKDEIMDDMTAKEWDSFSDIDNQLDADIREIMEHSEAYID